MGKYNSIFNVSGKVGDVVFYMLDGKKVARRLPKKKKGRKSKAQEEAAKINDDFGNASTASKMLRIAMADEFAGLKDHNLYRKVNRLMLKLKDFDTATPGKRTAQGGLLTESGEKFLQEFRFCKVKFNQPELKSAETMKSGVLVKISGSAKEGLCLTELQINLVNGKFRKHTVAFPEGCEYNFRKQFRRKQGFVTLFFLHGNGYVGGVVLRGC